jgi:hypothetical protein
MLNFKIMLPESYVLADTTVSWIVQLPVMSVQKQISEGTWGTGCSHPAFCVSWDAISDTHPVRKLYCKLGTGGSSGLKETVQCLNM